jgi:hypothetical protein
VDAVERILVASLPEHPVVAAKTLLAGGDCCSWL